MGECEKNPRLQYNHGSCVKNFRERCAYNANPAKFGSIRYKINAGFLANNVYFRQSVAGKSNLVLTHTQTKMSYYYTVFEFVRCEISMFLLKIKILKMAAL